MRLQVADEMIDVNVKFEGKLGYLGYLGYRVLSRREL